MRRRLLLIALAVLLVALAAPVIDEFVGQVIVIPLLYSAWFAYALIGSLPQALLWGGFVLVALMIAWRSLHKQQFVAERRLEAGHPPGRLERWVRLIRFADQERVGQKGYAAWRLANRLSSLALEMLADQERLSDQELRQQLARAALDIPPEVRAYLQAGIDRHDPSWSFRQRGWPFPAWRRSRVARAPLDLDPERVVQFIEARLARDRQEG